jgi:Resolvase, N terminal domain
MGAFQRVLLTAPDRLARNYVHQMVLLEELTQHGYHVEFLERPMSDDPHDHLLLQIHGAVAEYERTLTADRMRRGRQAKARSGLLLPWTVPPYGYLLDPEGPRDLSRLQLDPVKAAVVTHIFAWYTEPQAPSTLYGVAHRIASTGPSCATAASTCGLFAANLQLGTGIFAGQNQVRSVHRTYAYAQCCRIWTCASVAGSVGPKSADTLWSALPPPSPDVTVSNPGQPYKRTTYGKHDRSH